MSNGDQLELVARLLLALALGGVIGVEREFRGHEAGVRTLSLVALGAALFGEVSAVYGDSRVAAGVVQGIGFIGGGLIFQRGHNVRGVTTAATIWVAAGIGLIVSAELWLVAIVMTVVIGCLLELSPVSDWVYRHGRHHRGEGGGARSSNDGQEGTPVG